MDGLVPPPVAPRRISRSWLLAVPAIVILTALLVGAYFLFVVKMPLSGAYGQQWSAFTLPAELREAHFLSSTDGGSVLYAADTFSYRAEETMAGQIAYVAPHPLGSLFVEGGAQGFTLTASGRQFYASTSIVAPAISPDGVAFAFTRVKESAKPFTPDPSGWETVLMYRMDGRSQNLGAGTAPFFIDDAHLARITSAGVFVLDFNQGTYYPLLTKPFTVPVLQLRQSPDRSLAAWVDPETLAVTVYRVTNESMTLVASLPNMKSYALGDAALYEVRPLENGSTEIWKYELTTGSRAKKIHTFPATLRISQLYP